MPGKISLENKSEKWVNIAIVRKIGFFPQRKNETHVKL